MTWNRRIVDAGNANAVESVRTSRAGDGKPLEVSGLASAVPAIDASPTRALAVRPPAALIRQAPTGSAFDFASRTYAAGEDGFEAERPEATARLGSIFLRHDYAYDGPSIEELCFQVASCRVVRREIAASRARQQELRKQLARQRARLAEYRDHRRASGSSAEGPERSHP